MIDYQVESGGSLRGHVRVPGDKSISHRAVMLSAIAHGESRIEGLLEGEDVLATIAAFRALGVAIEGPERGVLRVQGVGFHGLSAPSSDLDMGNSGTALRLLAGLLSGQAFAATLTGDESLRRRPMNRIAVPLREMGADIATAPEGRPPVIVRGRALNAIDYTLPIPSAQVKSAILLAGLYARGTTVVREPAPSRDHTERMLAGLGYPVSVDGPVIRLEGGAEGWRGREWQVPADLSSATFFLVGAAMTPGSDLRLEAVGLNPTRSGVLAILRDMGATITETNRREIGGEPVADLHVMGGCLRGIEIPESLVPLAIDEFPALFVAAATAKGVTRVTGARELRVKETDRIAVVARALRALSVDAAETEDGLTIRGGAMRGGEVDSGGDHRIAMAFAMGALRADGPLVIRDCKNVDTSFPGFVGLAQRAGLRIGIRA